MRIYHGLSKTPEYKIWQGIKRRCLRKHRPEYQKYGAKGVTLHPAWVNDFPAFLAEIGERPTPKHTVDRIKGSLGYQPGNVRWATMTVQNRNKSTWVIPLTLNGRTMLMTDWAKELGINYDRLASRKRRGMTDEQVLSLQIHPANPPCERLTLDGRTMSIHDWSKETGLKLTTIRMRLKRGWSDRDALTRPV